MKYNFSLKTLFPFLKKTSLCLLCVAAVFSKAGAQNAADYLFSADVTAGNYTTLTGATAIPALGDDGSSSYITFGGTPAFTFNFCGASYSGFKVNSNGWLSLGNVTPSAAQQRGNSLANVATNAPVIMALWDDLWGGTTRWLITGTAPNRVFTYEALNNDWDFSADYYYYLGHAISFQIKLYETSGRIEIIYRQESGGVVNGSGGATIGIARNNTDYKVLPNSGTNPVPSSTTFTTSIGTRPATDQRYAFYTCTNPTAATITQGASVNRCSSDPATTLSLTGSLNSATTWQWYTGSCGGTLAGTGTSINVTPAANTTYYVRGEGGCVTPGTCANIAVNVSQAATISAQPAVTLNLCAGNAINLSVTAANATSYQWYGPGGIITGATTANLSIPNATTAMSGNYYVVVGAATPCGTVQSNNAIVTVNAPVNITNQPTGQTLCEGSQINLIVGASNTTGYQWYNSAGIVNNNGNTSGATTMNLIINPSVVTDASSYYVILTGLPGCPAVNSSSVPVTVNPAVTVQSAPPPTQGVCDGANFNLNIASTNGTGYAWSKDGIPLVDGPNVTGSATANLAVTNSSVADAGNYTLTISATSPCPSVNVTTTVTNDHPAAITTQPVNPNSCHGTQGSMTVVATGANLQYQWFQGATQLTNTTPYSGTTTPTLAISSVNGLNNLGYSVVVTGSCGSAVTSDIIVLTENFNNTWTGNVSNDWSNSSNWACGIVPTSVTNAIIPDVTNDPVVSSITPVCKDLMIDPNASVTFTGTNNKLTVHGNILNNGTLDGTGGTGNTIELAGIAQNITGAATFNNLEVTGGGIKTLAGNATVKGLLALTNGYLALGSNNLTVADMSLQSTGGTTSFVVTNGTGSVIGQNMGNAPRTFHVGTVGSSYTPVTIENTGDADTFSVRVMPDVYVDGYGVSPATVTNPVVDRTWMISEQTAGGSIATITPQWNAAEQINGFDIAHAFVAHYMNNEWTSTVGSAATAPAAIGTDPYTAVETNVTSFSPFTVASSGQFPLAIRLSSITATNVGTRNKVQWKSETEDAGDSYELESSADGKKFTKIATVAANGKPSTYTQWDEQPAQGVNYYRVKLLNVDGSSSYSKVVSATVRGTDGFSIEAYPNPVKNTVSVKVDGVVTGKATVVITDVTGKVVKAATQVLNNGAEINVTDLANGIYLLNYTDDVRNESIKINKQ